MNGYPEGPEATLRHRELSRAWSYWITSAARSKGLRDCQPERLGGLQVDHQLELRRLLDGKVGRLSAPEDSIDVTGRTPEPAKLIRRVGHEATSLDGQL